MVYDFLATSQEEKDLILSGKKTAQVFFTDFCGKEFKPGDKLVLMFPMDHAFGIATVTESRICLFSDVGLDNEWPAAGFTMLDEIMRYGQNRHPNFQVDVTVMFVRWGEILLPKEIDASATAKLILSETVIRALEKSKGKGTVP